MIRVAVISLSSALFLAACATPTTKAPTKPAPSMQTKPPLETKVPSPSGESVDMGGVELTPAPLPPVVPPPPVVPQPKRQLADGANLPAVQALLRTAKQQLSANDLKGAASSLERAQRLAPQSATVYQQLAAVRMRQSRAAEAEQLLRKGLAYAQSPSQQAAIWRQIAAARSKQGNGAGAQAALQNAKNIDANNE